MSDFNLTLNAQLKEMMQSRETIKNQIANAEQDLAKAEQEAKYYRYPSSSGATESLSADDIAKALVRTEKWVDQTKEGIRAAESRVSDLGYDIQNLKDEISEHEIALVPVSEHVIDNSLEIAELAAEQAQEQRDHEEKMAKIELMKLTEQRLAAEAARDAATIAKAQESDQFAAILKSLKDDES